MTSDIYIPIVGRTNGNMKTLRHKGLINLVASCLSAFVVRFLVRVQ